MRIIERLFWREFREGGPFVLIGIVLPLLLLAFPKFYGDIVFLPLVIIMVMVAVWASARAQDKRDSGLPMSIPVRLVVNYILPLAGVTLIGVSLGCLFAFRMSVLIQPAMIPLMIGICVFVFALCTMISTVYALIPAVLAGFITTVISFTFMSAPIGTTGLLLRTLGVVLITAVFWEGYRGKRRILIGRIAVPPLLALAMCWGLVREDAIRNLFHDPSRSEPFIPFIAVSENFFDSDGTLSMDYDHFRSGQICLVDKRIPRRYYIAPERIAPPGEYLRSLNCLDRRIVLFAVQAPGDARVRIMAWDMQTGQVSERFRFTGWRGMMANYCYTSHSPDNRYLILGIKSAIGEGDDLWLLNLRRNRATIVVPNTEPSVYEDRIAALRDAIWTPARVLLRLEMRSLSVDLQTLRVTPLRIGDVQ